MGNFGARSIIRAISFQRNSQERRDRAAIAIGPLLNTAGPLHSERRRSGQLSGDRSRATDCDEVDVAEATRKLEEENNAPALVEKGKETEEECWKKAIDDFFLYIEANGWVIDGW